MRIVFFVFLITNLLIAGCDETETTVPSESTIVLSTATPIEATAAMDVPTSTITPIPIIPTATTIPPTLTSTVAVTVTSIPPTATYTPQVQDLGILSTPVPTNTPTVEATDGWVIDSSGIGVALLDAPGINGVVISTVFNNTAFTFIGRTAASDWFQAQFADGLTGWLSALYVQSNIDTSTLPITGVTQQNADAQVKFDAEGLRLRQTPGYDGTILSYLSQQTPLTIIGRTADNQWLQVQSQGSTGWVVSSYVDVYINLSNVPVTGEVIVNLPPPTDEPPSPVPAQPTTIVVQPTSPPPATGVPTVPPTDIPAQDIPNYVYNITGTANSIYHAGYNRGNRPNVFSRVGDSITVATFFLYPIGWGEYDLAGFQQFQPAINYFSSGYTRAGNSFSNVSLAADNGWTTYDVLNPENANSPVAGFEDCLEGETPLECEYRIVKPSIALIMFGTNDAGILSGGEFQHNLNRIVQISKDYGVIPVLTTIPYYFGNEQWINDIVRQTAYNHGVPFIDYYAATINLPAFGLSSDKVHPSTPPGNYTQSAIFSTQNLQYGYTMRNITALQALDAIWRQVMSGG